MILAQFIYKIIKKKINIKSLSSYRLLTSFCYKNISNFFSSSSSQKPLPNPYRSFNSILNQIILLTIHHNIMHKLEQIKSKRHLLSRDQLRSPQTQRPQKNLQRSPKETASVNYQIIIRKEKPRKQSDKLLPQKCTKTKKPKFISDDIVNSRLDFLQVRSKSNHRERSAKLSPHNAEEQNAYQLLRASKRSMQGERKSKSKGDQGTSRKNVNTGNIKLRKEKSHSKDKLHLNLKLDGVSKDHKTTKKTKNGAKSSRKSEKHIQPKRFLSPQLVKLENSYYFSNYDEEEAAKPPQNNNLVQQAQGNVLSVPKKESKFIFESNQDFWNDPQSKRLLTSTVDMLN